MNRPLWISLGIAVVVVIIILGIIVLSGPAGTTVAFRETGLPSGRTWSVTIDNRTITTSNPTIAFRLFPASYLFDVAIANGTDYVPQPASGHLAVSTSGVTVSVEFVRSTANLTVREDGLPRGTPWTLAEGSSHYSSNATSITIAESVGNHSLRVLAADNPVRVNAGTPRILDDLYVPNVSHLSATANGSDVGASVHFTLALQMNYSIYAVPIFHNQTAPGSPAYEYMALTFYRYTTVNYSFHGGPQGIIPYPNVTAYLMTASEFTGFRSTGNATQYVLASGNVSQGNWSVNFASGTRFFVLTGWSVNEYHAAGWSWDIMFPGITVYFS